MKRGRKSDLLGQISRAERAIQDYSQDKSKKTFADVSSILIGPEDGDDQLKVVSSDDEGDLDNILEKDDDDSFNEKLGPFKKLEPESIEKVSGEKRRTPKTKIKIRPRVRESPHDDL